MKKLRWLVLILLLAGGSHAGWLRLNGTDQAPAVSVVSQSEYGVTLNVSIPGIEVDTVVQDSVAFVRLGFDGSCPASDAEGRHRKMGFDVFDCAGGGNPAGDRVSLTRRVLLRTINSEE